MCEGITDVGSTLGSIGVAISHSSKIARPLCRTDLLISFGSERTCLYRVEAGEEIGEHRQRDKPHADPDEDPAGPAFHPRRLRLDLLERPLFGAGNCEGRREDQDHHDDGRHHERRERRTEPADGQGVSGQTGQDRPGSAEAGEHIPKSKHGEPGGRPLAAQVRLPACQRSCERAHGVE